MGRLIVVEGLDGAGKRTLAGRLTGELTSAGYTVAEEAFPRYGRDVHADLVREALHHQHGDLLDSAYGMALLYALDRRGAIAEINDKLVRHDVLLVDRYVASNAAYQAARLRQDAGGTVVEWVRELEIDRFGLPVPDAQLLLRVPAELAATRAVHRERGDAARARDAFETDDGLQRRCGEVYGQLAERGWLAPWYVLDGVSALDYPALADTLVRAPR